MMQSKPLKCASITALLSLSTLLLLSLLLLLLLLSGASWHATAVIVLYND
jgi:hypothetical protein